MRLLPAPIDATYDDAARATSCAYVRRRAPTCDVRHLRRRRAPTCDVRHLRRRRAPPTPTTCATYDDDDADDVRHLRRRRRRATTTPTTCATYDDADNVRRYILARAYTGT